MNTALIGNDDHLRAVKDVLPSAILVVNHEFRILALNPAAKTLFKMDSDVVLQRLCGELMHCLHAMASDDCCGTTEHCRHCVIRNAVDSAMAGTSIYQEKYRMAIQIDSKTTYFYLLVTCVPLTYASGAYVLLVIEEVTEVIPLKRLLPICSNCKKIRNDDNYWEAVTDYLKKYADLEFTHSICPECAQKLYPDLDF
jgi:PAS domain-containing protein